MGSNTHAGRGPMTLQLEEDHSQYQYNLVGVSSGLAALDRVTKGWQPGTLVVVAAATSMGSTSFLINCMREAALYFKKPVVFFSLQHSREQILRKTLCAAAQVGYGDLTGNLADYRLPEVAQHASEWDLGAADIVHILDEPAPSLSQIRAVARTLVSQGASLLLVDNLHRIKLPAKARAFCSNREQEISYLIRGLKSLARELNVPVIVVSHLNRLLRDRALPTRPQLGDLRDSGSIEYEADVVLFLHRLEYYGELEDDMGNPSKDTAEIIVAKNAFGPLQTVKTVFQAEFGRFADVSSNSPAGPPPWQFGTPGEPGPFDNMVDSPSTIKLPHRKG